MWIAALFLGALLYSGTAAAFECAGMTLPSTLVICSDPELMRLADERQEAINEARGRIGEEAWPALWENQKAWVRSYATACGVKSQRTDIDSSEALDKEHSGEPTTCHLVPEIERDRRCRAGPHLCGRSRSRGRRRVLASALPARNLGLTQDG